MKYYLKEEFLKDSGARNAGNKARNDVEEIVKREGYQPLLLTVDLLILTEKRLVTRLLLCVVGL